MKTKKHTSAKLETEKLGVYPGVGDNADGIDS
jgi:hypothetical protein